MIVMMVMVSVCWWCDNGGGVMVVLWCWLCDSGGVQMRGVRNLITGAMRGPEGGRNLFADAVNTSCCPFFIVFCCCYFYCSCCCLLLFMSFSIPSHWYCGIELRFLMFQCHNVSPFKSIFQELREQRHKLHARDSRFSDEDRCSRAVPVCPAQEIRWVDFQKQF